MNKSMDITSSTGQGIALRVKSFLALVWPVINFALKSQGIEIVPADLDPYIDAVFMIAFGIMQVYGWIRARYFKKNGLGKYTQ